MARSSIHITKRVVDTLKPNGKDRIFWDDDVIGFGLRISGAGLITYVLQYSFEGRSRRYKIGVHGSPWTPESARQEARRLRGTIADGIDPQQVKLEQRDALTVGELCDLYVTDGLLTAKESSILSAEADIENHIKPLLDPRRAATLNRSDLEGMMRDIAEGKTARTVRRGYRRIAYIRGGKGAANSTLGVASAALGFGIVRKVREDNPAIGIRKYPEKKIERFLSPAELARLGEALSAANALGVESAYAIAALRLLILTGCRKNEILTLKRSHIDRYHRCLRLPDSKTGAKVVHLGAPAMRVILDLAEVAGNPFLLPGKKDGTHVTDLQSCWERIRKTAELEDVRIHDLRHSFASIGAVSGDSLLIIGALLGHRSAKTTERYTHRRIIPLKAAADRISDEIARHLDQSLAAGTDRTREAESGEYPFEKFWENGDGATSASPDPVLGAVIRTEWLDTRAAAAQLGFTVGTMQTYRWMGTGPAFRKIGRRVVYSVEALDAWKAIQEGDRPLLRAAA